MIDRPVIIVQRDPDSSNEFQVFDIQGVNPLTIDVDYGYANLDDPEEFDEWAKSHNARAVELLLVGTENAMAAAKYLAELVAEARSNYGHDR